MQILRAGGDGSVCRGAVTKLCEAPRVGFAWGGASDEHVGMEDINQSPPAFSTWRLARQEAIREERKSAPVPEFAKKAAEALDGVAATQRMLDDLR